MPERGGRRRPRVRRATARRVRVDRLVPRGDALPMAGYPNTVRPTGPTTLIQIRYGPGGGPGQQEQYRTEQEQYPTDPADWMTRRNRQPALLITCAHLPLSQRGAPPARPPLTVATCPWRECPEMPS